MKEMIGSVQARPGVLPATNAPRPIRILLIALGSLSLLVGIIGIFVPLLPTTVFLLITAACYARGSQRAYDWLMTNRLFGRYLHNYRENHGATVGTKIISITSLWVGIALAAYLLSPPLWLYGLLAMIAIAVTVHLVRLQTLRV